MVDLGLVAKVRPCLVLSVPIEESDRSLVTLVPKNVLFLARNSDLIRVEKSFTIDEVVFAEKGDLLLLGARSLEGLNLAVDPRRKKLVAAGPVPAA